MIPRDALPWVLIFVLIMLLLGLLAIIGFPNWSDLP